LSLSNLFFAMRMHSADSAFGDLAGRALNSVSDGRAPMQQQRERELLPAFS
jgi:hypothetical protein